ncbi:MAG: ribosome-associated translation inhibitor RaiA [Chloroflexi bacterium]|nr:ribosome-associated translation inhibitor RaiA [Chloroflexota bacterium]
MQVVVKGKNIEVSDSLRQYIQKRLGKLGRYLDNIGSTTVEVSREKTKSAQDRHVVQVTTIANGTILRGEEKADDPLTAVDAVADVMHRQIVRYKEKLYRRGRTPAGRGATGESVSEAEGQPGGREQRTIVKTKQFTIKPASVEEAVEQMELLGHDFFVFNNAVTGQVNVLYRRRDGNYGLIEPEPM